MRTDIARRREKQRDWESCYRTPKRRTCDETPIGGIVVDESKEPFTGARQTETGVAPRHACRCVTHAMPFLAICYFCSPCFVRALCFISTVIPPCTSSAWWVGGVLLADFLFLSSVIFVRLVLYVHCVLFPR